MAYLMEYFVLSLNGEESLNKFLSPDPGHLRGGSSHGRSTSCVQKLTQSEQQFLSYADRQTQMHYPRTLLRERG